MFYANVFKKNSLIINDFKLAKKELKSLSESMMNIHEIFRIEDVAEENHYLIIEFNDIILQLLHYLHFWREKKADKQNVKHLLKLMIQIVKSQPNEMKKRSLQVIDFFILTVFLYIIFFIFVLNNSRTSLRNYKA